MQKTHTGPEYHLLILIYEYPEFLPVTLQNKFNDLTIRHAGGLSETVSEKVTVKDARQGQYPRNLCG